MHPPEVARRRHQDAALAHHRLGDEGGDVSARLVIDRPLDHRRAALCHLFRIVCAERVAVDVGRRGEGDPRQVRPTARLARLVPGDGERAGRAPVERMGQRDELVLAGVGLGQPHGRLDTLGPGVAEETLLQAARGDLCQALAEQTDDRHVIDVGRRVDHLIHLRLGGGDHLRVAVSGVDDRDTGEAIDVLRSVLIPDGRPFRLADRDRLDRGDERCGHVVPIALDGLLMSGAARCLNRKSALAHLCRHVPSFLWLLAISYRPLVYSRPRRLAVYSRLTPSVPSQSAGRSRSLPARASGYRPGRTPRGAVLLRDPAVAVLGR